MIDIDHSTSDDNKVKTCDNCGKLLYNDDVSFFTFIPMSSLKSFIRLCFCSGKCSNEWINKH